MNGFFHVPEDYQHDLLYWLLHPELFLCWRVGVFPLHGMTLTGDHKAKPIFSTFVKITSLYKSHVLLCKFHMICISQPAKIWWQTSVQAWSTVWFFTILNSLKINILARLNNFNYKISNNEEFTFTEKILEKKKINKKKNKKISSWMTLVCMSIYIYIHIYTHTHTQYFCTSRMQHKVNLEFWVFLLPDWLPVFSTI